MRINKEQRQKGHTCQNKIRTSISQVVVLVAQPTQNGYVPTVPSRERGRALRVPVDTGDTFLLGGNTALVAQPVQKRVAGLQCHNWHLGIAHRSGGHRRHVFGGYERCFGGTANSKRVAGLQRDNCYLGIAGRCCGHWKHIFSGYERRLRCAADPKRTTSIQRPHGRVDFPRCRSEYRRHFPGWRQCCVSCAANAECITCFQRDNRRGLG